MMQQPWNRAQPDEWLPRSLRLCWGGDSDGGGGGMGGGGGWDGSGGGMGNTGGGDWGSAGSYDASGYNAGGDVGAYAGTAYDASTAGTGMGGGGDWGSFGDTNYSGMNAPNPTFADVAGPNPGVTTGGGDWGSAGTYSAAGTGGGPGGAMSFGGTSGGGTYGTSGGGGLFGDYGGGGGGGGGGYGGGGGGKGGGGPFGSFNTTSQGFANNPYGDDQSSGFVGNPYADDTSVSQQEGPDNTGQTDTGDPDAGKSTSEPAGDPDAGKSDQAPAQSDPTDPGPSLTDAAPAGNIGGNYGIVGHGTQTTAQADDGKGEAAAAPVAAPEGGEVGAAAGRPGQGVGSDYVASPEGRDAAPSWDTGSQPTDSFDSRFGDWGPQQAPSADSFDSRFGDWGQTQAATTDDSSSEFGPFSGPDVVGDRSAPQQAAPDFNQAFENFSTQIGWNPAEQTAGRTGLVEPTDWAVNPYAPSTDVSVGRDFNQAFGEFDTPTGMDLAGDRSTATGDVNPSSLFSMGWAPANANEGRGADYASGRAPQDYVTSLVSAAPAFVAAPAVLSTLSALTGISVPGLLGGATTTGGLVGGLMNAPVAAPPQSPEQPIDVEIVTAPPPAPEPQEQVPQAQPQEAPQAQPQQTQQAQPAQQPQEAPQAQPAQQPQAQPQEAPQSQPQAQPQEAPQAQPQQAPQVLPQEAQQQSPQVQQIQQALPQEAQQVLSTLSPTQLGQVPGLLQMAPGLMPQVQPALPPGAQTPQVQPFETAPEADNDAPEPGDRSQPPQDPNAPRPPANIPGQLQGSRGQYDNPHADTPQTSRTYRDPPGTAYTQGRPGITFRTARQAGIQPLFRTEDINTGDTDAQLIANINRALQAMQQRTGIDPRSLVATSGWRAARREEALEHGMDARTSQASVRSRSNPVRGRSFPAAEPGHSNHGPGRALDFADSRARAWLRQHAREFGLETLGGTFDMPHIQLQRGQGGQRPSAQEQAEQQAIDAQNRQAAIDRGLIAPGRGDQAAGRANQAAVPMPRGRPADAPQPEVVQPPDVVRPPADIPPPTEIPTALPPVALPDEPARPPADIPAPALVPPARGRVDRATQTQNALNIIKDSTAKLTKASGQAEFNAAGVVAAKGLAAAGVPLDMARSLMTQSAYQGAEKVGFGPSSMGWSLAYKPAIDAGIAAALQGYQPARPGEAFGPPSPAPDAPGKRSEAPFGSFVIPVAGGRDAGNAPAVEPGQLPGQQQGRAEWEAPLPGGAGANIDMSLGQLNPGSDPPAGPGDFAGQSNLSRDPGTLAPYWSPHPAGPAFKGPGSPYLFDFEAEPGGDRFLAKGGHVDEDEPVVVGEEGPEYFVPDRPGTVVPHMPQGGGGDFGRWPKVPTPDYPGRYAGLGREMKRQMRAAQDPSPSLMDMIDSGRLRLDAVNWNRMLNDPYLIALGRSRMDDRREGLDPGAEQYGVFPPAPAAESPDSASPMAQALGYDSIDRRPMRIGRQSYQNRR